MLSQENILCERLRYLYLYLFLLSGELKHSDVNIISLLKEISFNLYKQELKELL